MRQLLWKFAVLYVIRGLQRERGMQTEYHFPSYDTDCMENENIVRDEQTDSKVML
jgi:hypothetical protein